MPCLEHFHYYCDVVGLAMCGHSFTPARKDRAGDPDSMEWPRTFQFLRLHQ